VPIEAHHPDIESAVHCSLIVPDVDLKRLTADIVLAKRDSLLWNTYIQHHHYLGHQLMPGAQLRYFIRIDGEVVDNLHRRALLIDGI